MINSRVAETLERVYISVFYQKSGVQNCAKKWTLCLVNEEKEKVSIEQGRIL